MCLAVPAKVLKLAGEHALVDMLGDQKEVKMNPVSDKPRVGDYVLIQLGTITEILDRKAAEESLDAWRDILKQTQD